MARTVARDQGEAEGINVAKENAVKEEDPDPQWEEEEDAQEWTREEEWGLDTSDPSIEEALIAEEDHRMAADKNMQVAAEDELYHVSTENGITISR